METLLASLWLKSVKFVRVCVLWTYLVRVPIRPLHFYLYVSPRTVSVRFILSVNAQRRPLAHGDGQNKVKADGINSGQVEILTSQGSLTRRTMITGSVLCIVLSLEQGWKRWKDSGYRDQSSAGQWPPESNSSADCQFAGSATKRAVPGPNFPFPAGDGPRSLRASVTLTGSR